MFCGHGYPFVARGPVSPPLPALQCIKCFFVFVVPGPASHYKFINLSGASINFSGLKFSLNLVVRTVICGLWRLFRFILIWVFLLLQVLVLFLLIFWLSHSVVFGPPPVLAEIVC